MSKLISFSAILLLLVSCNSREKVNYPKTEKIVVTDTYFDTEVEDPYRWLEDDLSEEFQEIAPKTGNNHFLVPTVIE